MLAHTHLCTHTRIHTCTEPTAIFAKVSTFVLPVLACPSCSSLALGSGEKLVSRTEQTAHVSERLAFQPASHDVHMQSAHLHVRRPREGPAPRGVLLTAAPAPLALPSAPRPR